MVHIDITIVFARQDTTMTRQFKASTIYTVNILPVIYVLKLSDEFPWEKGYYKNKWTLKISCVPALSAPCYSSVNLMLR